MVRKFWSFLGAMMVFIIIAHVGFAILQPYMDTIKLILGVLVVVAVVRFAYRSTKLKQTRRGQ